MLKVCVYILQTIIFFSSCMPGKRIISSTERNNIVSVAKKDIRSIIQSIPPGTEKLYGLNSADELSEIEINETFCFFSIDGGQLIQSPTYFVPIVIEKESRALAKIEKTGTSYQLTDFGSANLAREIQPHIISNLPDKFIGILRIHHLYSDYMVFSKGSRYFFIPLQSARQSMKALGFNEKLKSYLIEDIINHINAAK